MKTILIVGMLLSCVNSAWSIELSQLEQQLEMAPNLRLSHAVVAQRAAQLARYQAESGWEIFASLGSGWQRESVDEQRQRSFSSLSERFGMSYPLLGAQDQQQRQQVAAQAELDLAQSQLVVEHQRNRLLLRAAYADYWLAQNRYRLATAYLAAEVPSLRLLEQRQQNSVLLGSDKLEFASGFDLVRREQAQALLEQQRARAVLELLTQQRLADWEATALMWPAIPREIPEQKQDAQLQQAQIQQTAALQQRQLANWGAADLRLSVGQGLNQQLPGELGGGLTVQLDLRLPLAWQQQRQSLRAEYTAMAQQAQWRFQQRQQELQAQLADLAQRQQVAQTNLDFAERRRQAALAAMSERQLRLLYLDGDVLEQSLASQLAFYQTSTAWLDALRALYAARLEYSALTNQWPEAQPQNLPDWSAPLHSAQQALRGHLAVSPKSECLSLYWWQSQDLLTQPETQRRLWPDLARTGVCRLLLSLNAEQIQQPELTRVQLQALLQQAQMQGVRVDWLLAEPSWIRPQARQQLLTLMAKFRGIAFQAVHLDLEPEQLMSQPDIRLIQDWLTTIDAVVHNSPWPVSLSLHPRHLEPHPTNRQWPCVGCRLQQLPLEQVNLMLYQRPVERVIQRVQSIRQSFPRLCLGVAQSVEPELSRHESYADLTQAQFLAQMQTLQRALAGSGFCGLAIQSAHDFNQLAH